MGLIKTSLVYLKRKYVQTIIMVFMMGFIVLGVVIGMLLYSTSIQAEEDAYDYMGAALYFDGEGIEDFALTRQDYEKIKQLNHVIGVDSWVEVVVTPVGTENVKIHTGVDPSTQKVTEESIYSGDEMTILAEMDVYLDDTFRWESSVSVIAGEYADNENGGIMVESRYAEANGLEVGDTIAFYSGTYDVEAELVICGIYEIDSDFEVLSSNEVGTSVYVYSPYNVIYMEYYAALEVFGFDTSTSELGAGIYLDSLDDISEVTESLKDMLGEDIHVYDVTDSYLEDECRIIRLMRRMAVVIVGIVFVLGSSLLLIVLSMFASQFQEETGRFLVLGCSRRWCVCRFGFITLCCVAVGFVLGMFVYVISGNAVSNIIWNVSSDVIYNSIGHSSSWYVTPNYRQGFEVSVETGTVFAPVYMTALFGALIAAWAVALAFPLYSVFRTRPRALLQDVR